MLGFADVRLPDDVEKGSSGGPQFFTSITTLSSGAEARNQNWQRAKLVYDISYGVSEDTFVDVIRFFYARRGRLQGFRFKDWTDFSALDQPCAGLVDGVNKVFQLQRIYVDDYNPYKRKITRPVTGTVVCYINGLPTSDFVLQPLGVITFATAPAAGKSISADFEFDVPVRFDNDTLGLSIETFRAAEVQSIKVMELPE